MSCAASSLLSRRPCRPFCSTGTDRDELDGPNKVIFSSSVRLDDPDFDRHPRWVRTHLGGIDTLPVFSSLFVCAFRFFVSCLRANAFPCYLRTAATKLVSHEKTFAPRGSFTACRWKGVVRFSPPLGWMKKPRLGLLFHIFNAFRLPVRWHNSCVKFQWVPIWCATLSLRFSRELHCTRHSRRYSRCVTPVDRRVSEAYSFSIFFSFCFQEAERTSHHRRFQG